MSDATMGMPADALARLIAGVRSFWRELDADAETRVAQMERARESDGADTDEHEVVT